MHCIYYINRLTTTKVDIGLTYLGRLTNNAQRIVWFMVRTPDRLISSQAPYPIAPHM